LIRVRRLSAPAKEFWARVESGGEGALVWDLRGFGDNGLGVKSLVLWGWSVTM